MWLCCHNLVEAMTGTRHMPTKTLWDIGATTVEMNAKKRVLCGQREMFMHHNPVVPTARNLAQQMPAVLIRSPRLTQMKHIQTMTEKSVNKRASPDRKSGEVITIHFIQNRNYFFNLAMIASATFLPESNIPPKIGPMRGVPATAEEAIPHT